MPTSNLSGLFKKIYEPIFLGIDYLEQDNTILIKITKDQKNSMFYYNFTDCLIWEK